MNSILLTGSRLRSAQVEALLGTSGMLVVSERRRVLRDGRMQVDESQNVRAEAVQVCVMGDVGHVCVRLQGPSREGDRRRVFVPYLTKLSSVRVIPPADSRRLGGDLEHWVVPPGTFREFVCFGAERGWAPILPAREADNGVSPDDRSGSPG